MKIEFKTICGEEVAVIILDEAEPEPDTTAGPSIMERLKRLREETVQREVLRDLRQDSLKAEMEALTRQLEQRENRAQRRARKRSKGSKREPHWPIPKGKRRK